ncbi:hypothetical protein [Yinghuangia seranimata]|uniref:hypothetical protein n=1 Tax=Yinghuangia seranimata TaxID=408067 RepID=UPI00248CDB2A|nr:hypothetical protein [Yinghuangia seranimata]MDI2131478.1 hypothetical protein [Yinghuangia seranimata]
MATLVQSRVDASGAPNNPSGGARPKPVRVLLLLAAAWVLPILTHLVKLDILLLALFWAGVASLLRTGGTLLDRMMVALGISMAGILTGGLLFSLWPWGLHPIPVAGTLFTALIAIGYISNRRPKLPRKVVGSDLVVLGSGFLGWFMLAYPVLGASTARRLQFFLTNHTGDRQRHFTMFDAIHQVGGYTYFDVSHAEKFLAPDFADQYPNGASFFYGFFDIFLRSNTNGGGGVAEYQRYAWLTFLGYGLLVLFVVWGARWIAGPVLRGWKRTLILTAVGVYLSTGMMMHLAFDGFDSEVLGLAGLAYGIAVLARFPNRPLEQTLAVMSAMIIVAFTYQLFVPTLAAGALVSLWVYRKRLLPKWRGMATIVVLAAPIALFPVVIPHLLNSALAEGNQFALDGFFRRYPRTVLIGVVIAILVAYALRRATRRSTAMVAMGGQLVAATVVLFGLAMYQWRVIGHTGYYFEKALHGWVIVVLMGTGVVGLMFRGDRTGAAKVRSQGWSGRLRTVGVNGLAAGLALVMAGGLAWGTPTYATGRPGPDTTWARMYAWGKFQTTIAEWVPPLYNTGTMNDHKRTLAAVSDSGWSNGLMSIQYSIQNHDLGWLYTTAMDMVKSQPQKFAGKELEWGEMDAVTWDWTGNLVYLIKQNKEPLRIVVFTPSIYRELRAAVQSTPGSKTELAYYPNVKGLPESAMEKQNPKDNPANGSGKPDSRDPGQPDSKDQGDTPDSRLDTPTPTPTGGAQRGTVGR